MAFQPARAGAGTLKAEISLPTSSFSPTNIHPAQNPTNRSTAPQFWRRMARQLRCLCLPRKVWSGDGGTTREHLEISRWIDPLRAIAASLIHQFERRPYSFKDMPRAYLFGCVDDHQSVVRICRCVYYVFKASSSKRHRDIKLIDIRSRSCVPHPPAVCSMQQTSCNITQPNPTSS